MGAYRLGSHHSAGGIMALVTAHCHRSFAQDRRMRKMNVQLFSGASEGQGNYSRLLASDPSTRSFAARVEWYVSLLSLRGCVHSPRWKACHSSSWNPPPRHRRRYWCFLRDVAPKASVARGGGFSRRKSRSVTQGRLC